MAATRPPEAAVFFVGALASDARALAAAGAALAEEFGEACLESREWDFSDTDYYREELGAEPLRKFWAFPGRFDPGVLAARKLLTNAMELRLAKELGGAYPRPVNLDPGYVTLAKLVLASAKNFTHRIYIGSGIYAEVTMRYRAKKGFEAFPWTFPDFASGRYEEFFLALRGLGACRGTVAR